MDQITRISFVALDGETPVELELDHLPSSQAVASTIEQSFRPFAKDTLSFNNITVLQPLIDPKDGIHLVYIYGHAWLNDNALTVVVQDENGSIKMTMASLLAKLLVDVNCEQLVIVLDCCHAAAVDLSLEKLANRLTLYGSGASEKAIALTNENSSRLSLTLSQALFEIEGGANLADIFLKVAVALDSDSVILGQTVSLNSTGDQITLKRNRASPPSTRNRTVRRVRNRLIASGGIVMALLTVLGWYVRNHTLVEVDLAELAKITTNIRLVGTLETPSRNQSVNFVEKQISGSHVRLWVPSGNIVLRVLAKYEDGQDRALARHMLLQPSFNIFDKTATWKLPAAEDVKRHPGMAHIPSTQWISGRDRDLKSSTAPYWIDIRPPTVSEYNSIVSSLMQSGKLSSEDSFILRAKQNSAAVDATGLDQLKSLNSDLGAIFGAIEAGTSNEVAAPGDLAAGLGKLACDDCPAPMSRQEAELFCETRDMTLPTDLQWELAVRGIDGRTFPWGDRFDHSKANVPGLPDKGDPPASLKPVFNYASQLSPFGLYDTVGNAGDWVINTLGAYEAVYMGATYRYNPEDATAFRLLPMTEETSLVREITARCVAR